jgi:hypothetical protein
MLHNDEYWYLSVCVGFLKTVTSRVPSSLHVSLVSRKEREPSFSSSMVNLMVGRTSLRWLRKGSTASHFNSHHPVSAKREAMKSLFNRARNVTLRKENQREEHLITTSKQNGYPLPFIRAISSPIQEPSAPPEEPDEESDDEGSQEEEKKQPLAVISYVSGVSERIRKTSEKFDLRVVFKSNPALRSLFTKVKDTYL